MSKGSPVAGSYIVHGRIEKIDATHVRISELPVGKWTADYKAFLESMIMANAEEDKKAKKADKKAAKEKKEKKANKKKGDEEEDGGDDDANDEDFDGEG